MTEIFISYATEDRLFAGELAHALSEEGWQVWWDRELLAGQDFEKLIEEKLQAVQCVLVVWSQASLRSRWVKGEARVGLERGVLIPIVREAVIQPLDFRTTHAEDLSTWDGSRSSPLYLRLKQSIERIAGPTADGVVRAPPLGVSTVSPEVPMLRSSSPLGTGRERSVIVGLFAGLLLGIALAALVAHVNGSTRAQVVEAFVASMVLGLVVGGIVGGQKIAARLSIAGAILVTAALAPTFEYPALSPLIGLPAGSIAGALAGRLFAWYRKRYSN